MRTLPIIEKLGTYSGEKPVMFSPFHLGFLIFFYLLTIIIILLFRNSRRSTMKIIVFIGWIILVIFEIAKQLISYYWYGRYYWANFPFQFCEVALYIYPILLINRNKKVENALISFSATFSLFGGLAILTLPFTGLSTLVFHSVRTMVHHGIVMVIGFYLFAWNRRFMNLKNFFKGSVIFIITVIIAVIFNKVMDARVEDQINMFFLNPNYDTQLLILKRIQHNVSGFVFVLLYIVSFYVIALLTFAFEHIVWKICRGFSRRKY